MVNCKKIIGTVAWMGGVFAVPTPFCESLTEMVQYNYEFVLKTDELIWYQKALSSYHSTARNELVSDMKGDWILFLDTDHQFDPDLLAKILRLINQCDFDVEVLTGLYQYKYPPYLPNIFKYNKKKRKNQIVAWWEDGAQIFPIDSSGAGCLFVKKSVFNKIKKELKQKPFDIITGFSEDISFFKRCKKLGIKAYCAPLIESNHLSYRPVTLKDRDLSQYPEFDKK